MTRKDLVRITANQDGGAHVEARLDPRYVRAAANDGKTVDLKYKDSRPTVKISFTNLHYATIRQMAYEVLESPSLIVAT